MIPLYRPLHQTDPLPLPQPSTITVIQPYNTPPEPESYFGLLTEPPGQYGRASYGNTTAFTLRGTETFARRAYNLFAAMGPEKGDREPVLRTGEAPNSWFFCMPPFRVKTALRRYLYAQLYKRFAQIQLVVDDEGDMMDTVCHNEEEMTLEAWKLAESFYLYEILPDHRTIGFDFSNVSYQITEHYVNASQLGLDGDE